MMEPTVTIHIGLPKSGSTAIQKALFELNRGPGDRCFAYPVRPGQCDHHHEALALLLNQAQPRTQGFWIPQYILDLWDENPSRFDQALDQLLNISRNEDRPVVISSEFFSMLSRDSVARILNELPGKRVRAVVVSRPVSELLPSWYQQLAKTQIVPEFEDFLLAMTTDLFDTNCDATTWMQASEVRQNWTQDHDGGLEVHVVPVAKCAKNHPMEIILADAELPREVQRSYVERVNESIELVLLRAWQNYLTTIDYRPTWVLGQLHELFITQARRHKSYLNVNHGQRLSLSPEAALLLDTAFPVSGDVLDMDTKRDLQIGLRNLDTVVAPIDREVMRAAEQISEDVGKQLAMRRHVFSAQHRLAKTLVSAWRSASTSIKGNVHSNPT